MSEVNNVIREIVCMLNNEEKILNALKPALSKELYSDAKYYYFSSLRTSFQNYSMTLTQSALTGLSYQQSLEAKKIDPYIVGGIADGIAGAGAGIYAASSAAERNRNIDESREQGRIETQRSNAELQISQNDMISIYNSLKNIVYSVPAAKQIHLNAYAEATRKKEQEKKQKIVEEKRTQSAVWISLIICIVIVGGFALMGVEPNFFIILIAIVISMIVGGVVSNKKIK